MSDGFPLLKIHEYQARELFQKKGIPVPKGALCSSPEEAMDASKDIGAPVVVKAQVLVAGRGKAGGIKIAADPRQAYESAKALIGSQIKGIRVNEVLVVEAIKAKSELYLGFTIDRALRKIALIASADGGMDLEELAKTKPDHIYRSEVDPVVGLHSFESRDAANSIGLRGETASEFSDICTRIYSIFEEIDADLAECNPLAIKDNGELVALDSRITIDDNAVFRHPQYQGTDEEQTALESEARDAGLAFVQLDGDVGIIGNGAGLVMASLDVVAYFGGRPANFLDMGGGSRAEEVERAVKIVLKQENLKSVFVNILGGITKCDEVATGLVKALADSKSKVPLVVRMVGTNEEEGRAILRKAGVQYVDSMESAALAAVEKAGELRS